RRRSSTRSTVGSWSLHSSDISIIAPGAVVGALRVLRQQAQHWAGEISEVGQPGGKLRAPLADNQGRDGVQGMTTHAAIFQIAVVARDDDQPFRVVPLGEQARHHVVELLKLSRCRT